MENNSTAEARYTSGSHLEKNPLWHTEESPWKAEQVMRMLVRHGIVPRTICEVGCGAGEVLRQLQLRLGRECKMLGCDVSPQAIALCQSRSNENLQFVLGDVNQVSDTFFDLILIMDVIEHMEDYFSLLRKIKTRARNKIFEIPLDLSVQTILRATPLLRDREKFGHIHYFNKELALQLLIDVGYRITDCFYTAVALDLPSKDFRNLVMRIPRRLAYKVNNDLAVRLLGGYRLLILAE